MTKPSAKPDPASKPASRKGDTAAIDAYIDGLPSGQRKALSSVRKQVKAAAPAAEESIGYGMPAFKYKGKPLVYFAASKNHCALYGPAVAGFEEDLSAYDVSKGTLRFTTDRPLRGSLVKRLVRSRMAAINAAAATKRNSKK